MRLDRLLVHLVQDRFKMENENVLLSLALVALVVSALGAGLTYYSYSSKNLFTGYTITQVYGTTNLTVQSSVAINFTVNNINFGTGYVIPGTTGATLISNNNTGGGDWNWTNTSNNYLNVSNSFVIANIGNVNVSLWIQTNKTASQFIGGTSPLYQYNVTNNASSCPGIVANASFIGGAPTFGNWHNVNTSNATQPWVGDYICRNMSFTQNQNNLSIDIKLFVPSDSLTGALGDFITATAQNAY